MSVKITTLKDNTKKITAELRKIGSQKLVVGVIDSTIAEYATYNEFGTKDIPQRSFLRSTYDEQIGKWERQLENGIKGILNMDTNTSRVWDLLGVKAKGDVQNKLRSNISPQNAPSTIKAKGSGKTTLFNTGALLRAITYEVRPR
jgi:hypothetical protein